MNKTIINTDDAPAAIGAYSQAVKVRATVYLSGQIPLDPITMEMQNENFATETHQVFKNLSSVAVAAIFSFSKMSRSCSGVSIVSSPCRPRRCEP